MAALIFQRSEIYKKKNPFALETNYTLENLCQDSNFYDNPVDKQEK